MYNIKGKLTSLLAMSVLAIGCAPVDFQNQGSTVGKVQGTGAVQPDGPVTGDGHNPTPPLGDGDDQPVPTDSDSRAPKCFVNGSTPLLRALNRLSNLPSDAIQGDDIPKVAGAFVNATVVAKSIGSISVAALSLIANAETIGPVRGSVGHLELAANSIASIESASAETCVSTHHMESIATATAHFALLGRTVDGVKASLGSLRGAAPFTLVKDFEVDSVVGALGIKFVNSHVKSLTGAGEIILQDSVIDDISQGFAGTIKCLGNSKILSRPDLCK